MLEIDGASNRGIDEIRQLRQNVNVRPSRSRFKIYIIDEVHMLTREAFNALLKTLEEPPEHVKFIFCTTEADEDPDHDPFALPAVRFRRHPHAVDLAERLQQIVAAEGVEAEPEALEVLARRAAGSMRDSQSLLGATAGLLAPDGSPWPTCTACWARRAKSGWRALVGTSSSGNAAAALAELDAAVDGRRRRGAVDRAAFRLPPRLHGRRRRLPGRDVPLCFAHRSPRR